MENSAILPTVRSSANSNGGVGRALSTSAGALLIQFILQAIAGWYLNRAYIPDPKFAHDTMEAILGASPHAQIAGFHYWGGAFFIVHSFLHLVAMMFSGSFRPPNHWHWIGAVAFFVCAMLFQITGNLLPFDQHGVQTAAIEAGISASMPGGQPIAAIMMGGEPAMNPNTLSTWYMAHRLLIPIALLVGALGGISSLLRSGGSRPLWIVSLLLALVPFAVAFWQPTPLGTAATPDDFNRYNALVSWYTLPLHGSLEAFNRLSPTLGWIGTAVIPTLFIVFLLAAPFLSKRLANAAIQLGFVVFLAYFAAVGLIFGGSFAPLTGTRDPIVAAGPKDPDPTPATAIDQALAERGRQAFNTVGCFNCHGIDGLQASGGPKLDQVFKEHSDADWYIRFIKNPKSEKPNSTMPGFPDLGEDQLKALAEFLRMPR